MATPTYRAASAVQTLQGFGTTLVATLPSGWVAGDLMLAVIEWQDSTVTFPANISTPAGWTQSLGRTPWGIVSGTPEQGGAVFSRIAQAGDTAPTFTFNHNTTGSATLASFTGVNGVTPIDAAGVLTQQTNATATPASGAYTTGGAGELLVSILMHNKANGAASDITAGPTGETIEWNDLDAAIPTSVALSGKAVATAQTVASSNWTCGHVGSNTSLAIRLALLPSSSGGGNPVKSPPGALIASMAHDRNAERKATHQTETPAARRVRLDYLHKRGH